MQFTRQFPSRSTGERNMGILLSLLVVVIVSGENVETVRGVLEESVLLPCPCSDRNLTKEFKWQKDNTILVFIQNETTQWFGERYNGRGTVFVNESRSNCSLLLTNITSYDQGEYRCIFHYQEIYTYLVINLNVSATSKVCQEGTWKTFQCDVAAHYPAEIQWRLDKKFLTNSNTTKITKPSMESHSGFYRFKSTLIMDPEPSSEPECVVNATVISKNITRECSHTGSQISPIIHGQKLRKRYFFIPMMLVLIITLVLWHRWKSLNTLSE